MTAPAAQGEAPAGITEPGTEAPPATGDEKLGEPGLKALQAERDARAAAEARVREFEQAAEAATREKLTEKERITLERDEHKTAAESAAVENAKLRVALEKGLPLDLLDRLVGSTKDELAADADKLLALLGPRGEGDPTGRPHEVLPRGGGDPTVNVGETDPRKIAAAIPRRY